MSKEGKELINLDTFLRQEGNLSVDVQSILRKLFRDNHFSYSEWLEKVETITNKKAFK
jgi:hypothetical protein